MDDKLAMELVSNVAHLSGKIEGVSGSIEELQTSTRDMSLKLHDILQHQTKISENQEQLGQQTRDLLKIVYVGNGQPPLMQRVMVLETTIRAAHHSIAETQADLNKVKNSKMLTRMQIIGGVIGMIITALMSAGAIAAALLAK
jgi:chromosome segregation ATPase